ncbi:MAG: FxsA family protein [Spirochaetales bacterium]|uniref:FxsA family protein n=1 Tax=Candidatus Thalassospirochaeta sargassi TaxID=3119039 RepID=A0AAJ1IBF9_9SPIO|nr:FxsA family protein [Spirochaetales bacterium]
MNTRFLLKLLDTGFIFRLCMILLALSLVVLGEFFLMDFISGFWGIYFTLALAASTGLAGVFLSYREITARITLIKESVSEGVYSEKDMIQLIGSIAAALLLLLPGFITDFFGIIGFFPVIRMIYGKGATLGMRAKLRETYEYLRLYD